MEQNPFASFSVEIPKQYADQAKNLCKTGSNHESLEFTPFDRQVDFWYFCFIYALKSGLIPKSEKDTSNITPASILSTDPYRISHIQISYIGYHNGIEDLANHRKVFNFALEMANAAMPHVLAMFKDDEQRPIWNGFDFLEEAMSV